MKIIPIIDLVKNNSYILKTINIMIGLVKIVVIEFYFY